MQRRILHMATWDPSPAGGHFFCLHISARMFLRALPLAAYCNKSAGETHGRATSTIDKMDKMLTN